MLSMTRGNLLARWLVVVSFSLMFLIGSAQAQFRGSLSGTVTDAQGAVVAGAKVTLVDRGTNRTVVATSDASGLYQLNALPPTRVSTRRCSSMSRSFPSSRMH